jgi:hypothetical protein
MVQIPLVKGIVTMGFAWFLSQKSEIVNLKNNFDI